MSKKDSLPSSDNAVGQTALEQTLAEIIVTTLHLDMQPSEVGPETRLMSEGLELTPINILDVALSICRIYCFKPRSDEVPYQQIFCSLRSLSAHVAVHATRRHMSKRVIRYVKIGTLFLYASGGF